ncbi:MAG: nuclear transport factor 2 family protein [Chloroflexota bacterium]
MNEQSLPSEGATGRLNSEETVLTYCEAWATIDPAARSALLERCWAAEGVYQDPQSRGEGRDGLLALIAGFHARRPGARILLTSGIDSHHGMVRFRWAMLGPDGEVMLEGFDIGELAEDGRLRRITGFFGPFPALPAR